MVLEDCENGIPNTPLVSTKKPRQKTASGHMFAIELDDCLNPHLVEIEGIGISREDLFHERDIEGLRDQKKLQKFQARHDH